MEEITRGRLIACWAVHLYTSLGLPINLLSLFALVRGDASLFFVLNLAAVAVDATDGFMARRLKVKEVIPHFDGAKLDDLIDYLTFTFLPVVAMAYLKLIPEAWHWSLGVVLIASAYGFSQTAAKTEDSFVGFPSYWNLVAIHIYLIQPPSWFSLTVIALCVVCSFIPIHFVYPTRKVELMKTTVIGGVLYGCALAYALFMPSSEVSVWMSYGSLVYVVYYFALSAYHHVQVQRAHSS